MSDKIQSDRDFDHAYNAARVFIRATDDGPVTQIVMIGRAVELARRQGNGTKFTIMGGLYTADPVVEALNEALNDLDASGF